MGDLLKWSWSSYASRRIKDQTRDYGSQRFSLVVSDLSRRRSCYRWNRSNKNSYSVALLPLKFWLGRPRCSSSLDEIWQLWLQCISLDLRQPWPRSHWHLWIQAIYLFRHCLQPYVIRCSSIWESVAIWPLWFADWWCCWFVLQYDWKCILVVERWNRLALVALLRWARWNWNRFHACLDHPWSR